MEDIIENESSVENEEELQAAEKEEVKMSRRRKNKHKFQKGGGTNTPPKRKKAKRKKKTTKDKDSGHEAGDETQGMEEQQKMVHKLIYEVENVNHSEINEQITKMDNVIEIISDSWCGRSLMEREAFEALKRTYKTRINKIVREARFTDLSPSITKNSWTQLE